MSHHEHCPACGAVVPGRGLLGDEYCSDGCALRSSDALFQVLEQEISRLAPQISREAFADAMNRLADDLELREEYRLQARPPHKASLREMPEQTGENAEPSAWARAVGLGKG